MNLKVVSTISTYVHSCSVSSPGFNKISEFPKSICGVSKKTFLCYERDNFNAVMKIREKKLILLPRPEM